MLWNWPENMGWYVPDTGWSADGPGKEDCKKSYSIFKKVTKKLNLLWVKNSILCIAPAERPQLPVVGQ